MFKQNIYLGRILGIPIGIDYSWFLIFVLLSWTLAMNYYPAEFKDWPHYLYWLMGSITSLMLFVSVLLHELGHSFVAQRFNLPVRSITLFVFGGVSQISSEPRSAWAEFWIAIAGPVVSCALGIIFYLLEPLIAQATPVLALVKYLAFINIILAVFNLIPGFPLDGGRVFRAIVWAVSHDMHKATVIAGNVGRIIAFVFIYIGVVQIFSGNVADGLWIIFIGWFLESAASAQIHQQEFHNLLRKHSVKEAMNQHFAIIPSHALLEDLISQHIIGEGRRYLIVLENEEFVGLLTLHRIKEVSREKWASTSIDQVMIPMSQLKKLSPQTGMWEALQEMDRDGVNQLPVMEEMKIVGVLSREDVITFLRNLQSFKS